MQQLTPDEAKSLIERVGPHLGCGDHTYGPKYPDGREDVAAIRRMAENGYSYGFDTIYVVWKTPEGELRYRDIRNSRGAKDYIFVDSIRVESTELVVELDVSPWGSGANYTEVKRMKLSELGLR